MLSTWAEHGLVPGLDWLVSRLSSVFFLHWHYQHSSTSQAWHGPATTPRSLVSSWRVSDAKPLCEQQEALVLRPQLGAWRQ